MKPSSAKAKGRIFQQYVRDKILSTFPELEVDDVRSTSMGAGGEDVQLSPAARRKMQYQIECKSRDKLAIYGMYEQAQTHGKAYEPLVVVKQNHSKPLAIVDLDHFMELVKRAGEKT